jgi:hypothetical protein
VAAGLEHADLAQGKPHDLLVRVGVLETLRA